MKIKIEQVVTKSGLKDGIQLETIRVGVFHENQFFKAEFNYIIINGKVKAL